MSKRGGNGSPPDEQAFDALERAVTEVLKHLEGIDDRMAAAEAQSAELSEVVKRFTGDEAEAGMILTRLHTLEEENTDLRRRLEEGREGVDRILARIRFLENQG